MVLYILIRLIIAIRLIIIAFIIIKSVVVSMDKKQIIKLEQVLQQQQMTILLLTNQLKEMRIELTKKHNDQVNLLKGQIKQLNEKNVLLEKQVTKLTNALEEANKLRCTHTYPLIVDMNITNEIKYLHQLNNFIPKCNQLLHYRTQKLLPIQTEIQAMIQYSKQNNSKLYQLIKEIQQEIMCKKNARQLNLKTEVSLNTSEWTNIKNILLQINATCNEQQKITQIQMKNKKQAEIIPIMQQIKQIFYKKQQQYKKEISILKEQLKQISQSYKNQINDKTLQLSSVVSQLNNLKEIYHEQIQLPIGNMQHRIYSEIEILNIQFDRLRKDGKINDNLRSVQIALKQIATKRGKTYQAQLNKILCSVQDYFQNNSKFISRQHQIYNKHKIILNNMSAIVKNEENNVQNILLKNQGQLLKRQNFLKSQYIIKIQSYINKLQETVKRNKLMDVKKSNKQQKTNVKMQNSFQFKQEFNKQKQMIKQNKLQSKQSFQKAIINIKQINKSLQQFKSIYNQFTINTINMQRNQQNFQAIAKQLSQCLIEQNNFHSTVDKSLGLLNTLFVDSIKTYNKLQDEIKYIQQAEKLKLTTLEIDLSPTIVIQNQSKAPADMTKCNYQYVQTLKDKYNLDQQIRKDLSQINRILKTNVIKQCEYYQPIQKIVILIQHELKQMSLFRQQTGMQKKRFMQDVNKIQFRIKQQFQTYLCKSNNNNQKLLKQFLKIKQSCIETNRQIQSFDESSFQALNDLALVYGKTIQQNMELARKLIAVKQGVCERSIQFNDKTIVCNQQKNE